ncbi:MAG: response regulator [Syntrophobacteraceae bacterium]
MKILVVEDDKVLADGLMTSMMQAGHAADWTDNGEEADIILSSQVYDLVILDLGLPHMDGLQVLERMRKRGIKTPVLILTARDAVEERISGLDAGADDYITKPFNLGELEARVRVLLRRGQCGGTNEICLGSLAVDTVGKKVTVGGRALDLSARELCILEVLLRNIGHVVSKSQILEKMYGWDEDVSENAIEVFIHRLRKKMDGADVSIRNVRGLGYSIIESNE